MEKQKDNLFTSKFHMLNSQENNDDINWSSSASSDYENGNISDRLYILPNRNGNRKRKRKKIVPKNISNLHVTVVDVPKERKENKSPILNSRCVLEQRSASPILMTSLAPKNSSLANSPILYSRNRSPILLSKSSSPNIRKKLFKSDTCSKNDTISSKNKSILNENNLYEERGLYTKNYDKTSLTNKDDLELNECNNLSSYIKRDFDSESSSTSNNVAQMNLVNKVKSFFDSHFSSENTSQNSISDSATPKESSRTSDEIEILTCKSLFVAKNINQSIKQEDSLSVNSSNEYFEQSSKKIRYKKNGLAYRLNNLVKKQKTNILLWQHERYLAENSNFIIPKEEHIVFCVQIVHFKYGCYLLEATNINNDKFLILINRCNISINITCDLVFKLYAPYKILDVQDFKLIINVNKFECITMKQ